MVALFPACIKRNNPFDPVNQPHRTGPAAVVYDKDTLMSRVKNAVAGDTILIGAGSYEVSLRFLNNGTPSAPIVVAAQDNGVILTAPPNQGPLFISAGSNFRFYNLTFRASASSGVKVEYGSSAVLFDKCTFSDNALDGLEIVDSDVRVVNCSFLRNKLAGIRISGKSTGLDSMVVDNALIAHNGASGIDVTGAVAIVSRCTASNNGGGGFTVASPAGAVSLAKSIVSFNTGSALSGQYDPAVCAVSLDSCDFFANGGALSLTPALAASYFTLDPVFTDTAADDFSIGPSSGIDAMERQGTIIGYRK
jgi:hypothetical protein